MSKLDLLIECIRRFDITGEPTVEQEIKALKLDINAALKLQKEIKYRAKHPMAMNYLQFEDWINKLIKRSKENKPPEHIGGLTF